MNMCMCVIPVSSLVTSDLKPNKLPVSVPPAPTSSTQVRENRLCRPEVEKIPSCLLPERIFELSKVLKVCLWYIFSSIVPDVTSRNIVTGFN